MTTSNFAREGKNPKAIAISSGVPKGWYGKKYTLLAPSRNMLTMSIEDFDKAYLERLKKLSAKEVYNDIVSRYGEDCILLCWESPNVKCHRRLVAEWFEKELGIIITEQGFLRENVQKYAEMPEKLEKKSKKEEKSDIKQLELF